MGTFSDVSKALDSTVGNGEERSMAIEIVRVLTGRDGGIHSLIQVFEQQGLGHIIASWIGNGQNATISTDQVKTVLGSERLAELAKKVGVTPEKAAQYLSGTLPALVDALTPSGKLADANDLQTRGKEILAALFSKPEKPQA